MDFCITRETDFLYSTIKEAVSKLNCTPKVGHKTLECSLYMKRTFSEKLNIVSQALSGVPRRRLCEQYHLGQHYLEDLIDRYLKYGENGLNRKSHTEIPPENRIQLVRDFIEKGVTLRWICNENRISRTAFESWVRKARVYGYDSLRQCNRRGRPPKDQMAKPKKEKPQTELEKLQAENLRLRAENALLKKVRTLVEEQKTRAHLNGYKPSTN